MARFIDVLPRRVSQKSKRKRQNESGPATLRPSSRIVLHFDFCLLPYPYTPFCPIPDIKGRDGREVDTIPCVWLLHSLSGRRTNRPLPAARTPLCAPRYDVVALATSAGGLAALTELLSHLPAEFPAAITVVQHLSPHTPRVLASILEPATPLQVRTAGAGDRLQPGCVYVAPPDRHLRVTSSPHPLAGAG